MDDNIYDLQKINRRERNKLAQQKRRLKVAGILNDPTHPLHFAIEKTDQERKKKEAELKKQNVGGRSRMKDKDGSVQSNEEQY